VIYNYYYMINVINSGAYMKWHARIYITYISYIARTTYIAYITYITYITYNQVYSQPNAEYKLNNTTDNKKDK